LINAKKKKIGAGYLSNEGALYLIASDLGILLAGLVEVKKNPMGEIQITQVTKDDLEKRFNALNSDKRRSTILSNLIGPFLMIALSGAVFVAANFDTPDLSFYLGSSILVGFSIGIIIVIKLPSRKLEKKEMIFFEFYKAYKKISEYKYRDANINTKKYLNAIKEMSYFIGRWTRTDAPTAISELPDSIGDNLSEKAEALFKENNSENIQSFIDIIEKFTMFCYDKEPSAELLRAFNEQLIEIDIKESKKTDLEKPSNLLLKLIWIPPILGIILFVVFNSIDSEQIHASLGYSLSISVIVLVAIVTLVKRGK